MSIRAPRSTSCVSSGAPTVVIPSVVNQTRSDARQLLEAAPYTFDVTLKEEDSDLPKGQVIRTDPDAGRVSRSARRSRSSTPTAPKRSRTWSTCSRPRPSGDP